MDSLVIQLPEPVAAFLSALRTDKLQEYLHRCGAESWCFLTAQNPGGEVLTDAENEARTRQVVEHVRLLGCWGITRASSDCPAWIPEGGILIIDIAERDAQMLGRDLGQNAIIVGNFGSCRIRYDTPHAEA